jgi:hypothetical protein
VASAYTGALAEDLGRRSPRDGSGLAEAVRLFLTQAQVFGLELDDVGLWPDFDPNDEPGPANRPGHFAG